MIVAFQGEQGAYSEEALRQHFDTVDDLETLPCRSLADLFQRVEENAADCGMVPLENSLGGSVTGVTSLLFNHDLRITGETLYAVRHNLLVVPGCKERVQIVRSHPQALEQCRSYLVHHNYKPEDWYDTAGAAKTLAEHPDSQYGAIASVYAAECYGLEIADRGIEDHQSNQTRFLVVGGDESGPVPGGSKTSLLFSVPDTPGSLVKALQVFADLDINLSCIISFPNRTRCWTYNFYVDFQGHWQEDNVHDCLSRLVACTTYVKVLGSYPAAAGPATHTFGK